MAVYEQEYHWTLVTLYALDELERVDALEAELRENDRGFFTHWAWAKPVELERQRERILRRIEGGTQTASGMAAADLRTFPGMPDYRKPVN